MNVLPGASNYIKEAMTHLKRLSDSSRRANALKAAEIIKDVDPDRALTIANDILQKEYKEPDSPSKQTV